MRNKAASENSKWYKRSKEIFSNYQQDFVLIGIPKCAFNTLRDCLPLPQRYGHYSHDFLYNHHKINPDIKCVTFVRNPWDRLVSWFFYHKTNNINAFPYDNFEDWVKDGCKHGSWNLPVSYYHPKDPLDMHAWMGGSPDNMDFIGKIETIDEDLVRLGEELGIHIQPPKKLNTSRHKNYRELYTDETRKIVEEIYGKDIETFKYEF